MELWATISIALSIVVPVISILWVFYYISRKNFITGESDSSQTFAYLTQRVTALEKENVKLHALVEGMRDALNNAGVVTQEIKNTRDEKIKQLTQEVNELKQRILYLEGLLYSTSTVPNGISSKYEILIIGGNDKFLQTDENALQKARLEHRYTRIASATKAKIDAELRRRRHNNMMYKYVIISAHMSKAGVFLADGTTLDGYWLARNLQGVDLLYLNGCESVDVADIVHGVTNYVISMMETVPDSVAGSFAYAFWRKIEEGDSVEDAFNYALNVEPAASPYVDLQMR